MFQGRIIDNQIFYFDNIKLVKSNYEDKGECYDSESSSDSSKDSDKSSTSDRDSDKGNNQKIVSFYKMLYLLCMFLLF